MKKKIAQIREYAFYSNFSFWLLLILLLSLFTRGFPAVSKFYIITPILLLLFTVFGFEFRNNSKHFKIIISLIFLFTIWSIVTAFWSDFPLFTIKRGIYFFIVSVGSFIIGHKLVGNNLRFLYYSFLILNVAIITVSLISLVTNLPQTAWSGGHGLGFMGFTNHQNKLGQYIFLSAAPLVLFANKTEKINKYFVTVLFFVNLILLALSVSRAAILALSLTWFIYFLLNFSLFKTLIFSSIFFGVIFATVFVTKTFTDKHKVTIIKNENYLGQRREKTIYYSWKAALNGGLTGLGYGISDKRFKPELLGYYDKTSEGKIFRREKTISVLALTEEVGIIGLGLFFVILFYPLNLLRKKIRFQLSGVKYPVSEFLIFSFAFLISLNFYAQIESWWIGIGTAVMPVYFIFTGAVIFNFNRELNNG